MKAMDHNLPQGTEPNIGHGFMLLTIILAFIPWAAVSEGVRIGAGLGAITAAYFSIKANRTATKKAEMEIEQMKNNKN